MCSIWIWSSRLHYCSCLYLLLVWVFFFPICFLLCLYCLISFIYHYVTIIDHIEPVAGMHLPHIKARSQHGIELPKCLAIVHSGVPVSLSSSSLKSVNHLSLLLLCSWWTSIHLCVFETCAPPPCLTVRFPSVSSLLDNYSTLLFVKIPGLLISFILYLAYNLKKLVVLALLVLKGVYYVWKEPQLRNKVHILDLATYLEFPKLPS